jgi:hypothetical protein
MSSILENQANRQLEKQLNENNYEESDLISIKIPAKLLPYYSNSKQFERIDGRIEMAGISYNYVKRRLFNDSLELLCIPNVEFMKLQNANDNFFKLVNDLQHNGMGKKPSAHPSQSKNCSVDPYIWDEAYSSFLISLSGVGYHCFHPAIIHSPLLFCADQPPEYNS